MRVSNYNIVLPFKNRNDYLIIQGGRGSFDVVDKNIADCMNGEASLEDSGITKENLQTLARRGYITNQTEEQEFAFIHKLCKTMNEYSRRIIQITLLPTYNCNFRCEYCFEHNLQKNGSDWLAAKMTKEIVDAVFGQIDRFKEEGRKVKSICLFGGEPLLRSSRNIVEYICAKAMEAELPVECISNGYDLDKYLDLTANFTYVQITLDGIGIEHDIRRYLVGGQGTFDQITKNIDLALANGTRIVLRSNVNRKNIDSVGRLIDFYHKKGWAENPLLTYYFKSTINCYDPPKDRYSDVELMQVLAEKFPGEMEKFKFNSIYHGITQRIYSMLVDSSYAPMRSGYCGAMLGMYSVDPFGDIYPCWDMLSDKTEVIGKVNIEEGRFEFNGNHDRWKLRTVDKISDCHDCKYLLFCGGGCAAQAKVMHNDMNKVYCDNFQKLFDQAAIETCEGFLSQTEKSRDTCAANEDDD